MDTILKLIGNMTLSDLGSMASIISLVFTVLVLIDVRRLKNYYLFTARVPSLARKLNEHASKIDWYLKNFDSSTPKISLELATLEVALNSLKRKLDRKSGKSVAQLLKDIRQYDIQMKGQNGLRQIYVDLKKIIAEIEDLQEDLKWER